jgi:hypothetical protein
MKKLLLILLLFTGCASIKKELPITVLFNENIKEPVYENYTVIKHDCLWTISKEKYGDAFMWWAIYKENRDIISNPDLIEVNDNLKIKLIETEFEKHVDKRIAYMYKEKK